MQLALEQRGIKVGLRRLKRIMREHGWLHEKRRRPHGITKANPEAMITENIIKQDFSAQKPFEKTLTDITQIQCMNGKLYVSPILDCFDGEILALRMADNMRKELCTATLDSMVLRFPQTKGAILHSDRGSQYTSDAFRVLLEQYEMKQSLSGVDHCYDSLAVMTTRKPSDRESDRFIFAVFLVSSSYSGDDQEEGNVTADPVWRIELKPGQAERILFWNYYYNARKPEKIAFGSGLHRYLTDIEACQILRDIAIVKDDDLSKAFFKRFCELNHIDPDKLESPSRALLRQKQDNE